MVGNKNFLLGYGERLTKDIPPPKIKPTKEHPYTFEEAKTRLSPKLSQVSQSLTKLPDIVCPNDQTVAVVTIHPTYLAKSHYPEKIFRATNLRAIGSRSTQIRPEKDTKKKESEQVTAELFIAGPRASFTKWAQLIPEWSEVTSGADDIQKIEDIKAYSATEKIKPILSDSDFPLLEIVLHANESLSSDYIIEGFQRYVESFDLKFDMDKRIYSGGLCFLPLRVPRELIVEVAKYSFLRVLRGMPSIRQFHPILRTVTGGQAFNCLFPDAEVVDPNIRVAIFDGGIPSNAGIGRWVRSIEPENIKTPIPAAQEHGLWVTSSFLFGSIKKGEVLPTPYAKVDHYRIIDEDIINDSQGELFSVLKKIVHILENQSYSFVNLSLGPDLPIEDDDVHVWTAKLDEVFSKGDILATIAAGNSGECDEQTGLCRIQPPADCVNGIAIGASDSGNSRWRKADYSSVGPGRSPGVVKPDFLTFGGSENAPFWVLNAQDSNLAVPTLGTSFACPSGLRTLVGVRAHMGEIMTPMGLKALSINHCQDGGHPMSEVGWGKLPNTVEELIICQDGSVRVLYQGELEPGQWIRAEVPLPELQDLLGTIGINATFCFASNIDPEDPINYTKSGLEIVFRPDITNLSKTKTFFQKTMYSTEAELRRDAHKWETTISKRKGFRSTSLNNPVFDIHYNARSHGGKAKTPEIIPYALVLCIEASKIPNLYDKVVTRYRTILEILQPVIQIPISIRGGS